MTYWLIFLLSIFSFPFIFPEITHDAIRVLLKKIRIFLAALNSYDEIMETLPLDFFDIAITREEVEEFKKRNIIARLRTWCNKRDEEYKEKFYREQRLNRYHEKMLRRLDSFYDKLKYSKRVFEASPRELTTNIHRQKIESLQKKIKNLERKLHRYEIKWMKRLIKLKLKQNTYLMFHH